MFSPRITLRSLRRQFEALKRKYARVIASIILKPVADEITRLWAIAVEKKQPKPSPILCLQKVVKAGFHLPSFKAFHIYIEDCRRYGGFPNTEEITNKLLPPKTRIILHEVLPNRFPARRLLCVFASLRLCAFASPNSQSTNDRKRAEMTGK